MTKRRIILVSVVCFSIAVFTVQTLSQTRPKPPDTERLWNMTEEEREKEFAKRREQWKLYLERSRNMTEEKRKWKWKWEAVKGRRQWELESAQKTKEHRKKSAERKLSTFACFATDESGLTSPVGGNSCSSCGAASCSSCGS